MNAAEGLLLRPATPEDLPALLLLIGALADYEGLRHELRLDPAALGEDLFGPRPCIVATLACVAGEPVGYALAYRNYSTFLCRQGWFLEDLFVLPAFRRRGIGRAFFRIRLPGPARRAVAVWSGMYSPGISRPSPFTNPWAPRFSRIGGWRG